MTVIEYDAGDDVSGSSFLDAEGTYHMIVMDTQCPMLDKEGRIKENGFFRLYCEVLNGTVPNQQGKTIKLDFYHPQPNASDKSKAFTMKKRDRMMIAINQMKPDQLGQKVRIDTDNFQGEQFVVTLERELDKETKQQSKWLSIKFADIYHVDDPEVKSIPKDEKSLALIHPSKRWIGDRQPSNAAVEAMKNAGSQPAPNPPIDLDNI